MSDFVDVGTDIVDAGSEALGLKRPEGEKALGALRDRISNTPLPNLQAERLRSTAFNRIKEDPALRAAQQSALSGFQQFARGVMTPADQARVDQINQAQAAQEQGQRQAILQNAQARGVAGSGLEQQSLLANQQGSAQRANQQALELQQQLQQRQLQATGQLGALAGDVRGQEFHQKAQRAAAADIINRFNLENRARVPQQQFENQMSLYNAGLGAAGQVSASEAGRGGRLASIVGAGVSAAAGAPRMSSSPAPAAPAPAAPYPSPYRERA